MSIIKSFSVGNGDTFYIKHGSDNFTIIDCYLSDDNKETIVDEILSESRDKGIRRFISTHPDEDHICGLEYLDERLEINNFYCVKNEATKEDETVDFKKYCELRDDSKKAFYIKKGVSRKWMNQSDEERGSAGINILWPDTDNADFKDALDKAKNGESPNNISAIIKYSLENGVTVLWLGDLETDFMEKIKDEVEWPKVDILFAPHHGRESGKIPQEILDNLDPKIIIIGEAPSKNLNYYQGYNKITQNSAGDITFECVTNKVHIYVSNENYTIDFLNNENLNDFGSHTYLGTLNL
ncbi:ComEC/Rec2 family competence protein [Bacillus tuaregi]|uniref:ComEC/Rec2 family competence protein n=1 Tax=Bacillus tuaregi TaxID=1816695 RepID=UPI0008F87F33|nr:hypothetical protein [Bacillus tuaregi]